MAYTTDFPGADGLSAGLSLEQVAMLGAYATLMLGVCLLACIVPTRRALGVEPTIALRVD
jgi:putative ABC transport system permease protein